MKRILEPEAMDTAEEAEDYDGMNHSDPNRNFMQRLFELGAHGHLLDLGTGPAHLPIMIAKARPDLRVTGIDLAHHMLRVAAHNIEASGLGDRIELKHGDAKALGLEAASFDTVYSNTILHHIPDPRPFLAEAKRMVKPGGTLLIRDLFRPPIDTRVDELVELYAGEDSERQQNLFAASLRAAFTPEELRDLADQSGLTDCEVVIDTDRHMSLQRAAR